MSIDWIASYDAYRFVSSYTGADAARFAICQRAHAGLIQARAKLLTVSEGDDSHSKEYVHIPVQFWWAGGHEALEQNWRTGDFSTWTDKRILWRAYGVSFDRAALLELVPGAARVKAMATISILGSDEWITARDARKAVYSSGLHGTGSAAAAIIELCRTGHVVGRALRMELRSHGWTGKPKLVASEWDIPPWFWHNFTARESSSQQWEIGTFKGRGKTPEGDAYVSLSGVHFLRDGIALLTGGGTQGGDSAALAESTKGATELPPLPDAKLSKWWEGKAAISEGLTHDEIAALLRAAFPDNHVTRDRIRALTGRRKQGPKPISG